MTMGSGITITTVVRENSGLTVTQYNPRELLTRLDTIELAVVPSTVEELLIRKEVGKRLERVEITLNHTGYLIYHDKNIEFHRPPLKGSGGSHAKYYVWDEEKGLALQRIQHLHTSCNYHTKGSEKFYSISGSSLVCICSCRDNSHMRDVILKNGEPLIIDPYYCHRLTVLCPTLNIILMPPGVGRTDHHYPEICYKHGSVLNRDYGR